MQAGLAAPEEGVRPLSQNGTRPAFEKVDTMGSYRSTSTQSITSKQSQEPVEYKMSGRASSWRGEIELMG